MHGKLTDAELTAKLKADAERPIDLEMLTSVFEGYEGSLQHYSAILREAVPQPRKQGDRRALFEQERTIETHVASLGGKLPIWREHLEKVFEFLEELRVGAGRGLLTLGEFEATSAHWLAQLVFTRTVQGWNSCKGVAHRSQTDARYLYAVNACEMFFEHWFPKLPNSQALSERMREEFVLARIALKNGASVAQQKNAAKRDSELVRPGLGGLDNESKELVLVGEFQATVAAAGHIPRMLSNSDWGIDAEIEFKDQLGNASGKRLYLQLKSGDSHLTHRQRDNANVFRLTNVRHAQYWRQQAYPVMLVVRKLDGTTQWMNVSRYLDEHWANGAEGFREIVFQGENFTVENIKRAAEESLTIGPERQ